MQGLELIGGVMMPAPWENIDLDIPATEFETLVKKWIEKSGEELNSIEVIHNQKLEAYDSTYQIDVFAKFQVLGIDFVVLIECKKHKSAIPRTEVQILHDKIRSIGAHKGMMFTTSKYQSGAIKYAKEHGIALITVSEGSAGYVTRSQTGSHEPPPWADVPDYIGWLIKENEDNKISMSSIDFRNVEFLKVVKNEL